MTLKEARKAWEADDKQIRTNVNLVLSGASMNQEQLGKMLGMTAKTLRTRLKNPSEFTFKEMRTVSFLAESHGIILKTVNC